MSFEFKPVLDPKTGEVQLYDIFVDDEWVGSRRTPRQCFEALRNIGIFVDDPALPPH